MKNITLLALSVLILTTCIFAQPDTLWTKTFGGAGSDRGFIVRQTTDDGFILVGETNSFGAGMYDVYLVKTDASGIEQWNQTFGGSGLDYGSCVQQTSDGGYIIVGGTTFYGAGGYDIYLIKTDASGTEQWSRTFGGSDFEQGYSVQQTSDGGYIVAGGSASFGAGSDDVYLIKTDASGNEQWSQTYGGSNSDWGYSVQQTSDGGYIITGITWSYGAGSYDIYLIKTDSLGFEQWSQTFGGIDDDYGYSVQQTDDGGYIVAGGIYSNGTGSMDVYLIKTDASGIEQWSQTFGGDGSDEGMSVQQTSDGGYIITGYTGVHPDYDVYLFKTDGSGIEQWSQTFGGSSTDKGNCVQRTGDGGYIITGYTESYGAGNSDFWLIRLDSETGIIQGDEPQPLTYSLLPAYPNPFNPTTLIRFQMPVAGNVQIQVYDVQGNLAATLADGWQKAGSYQASFDANHLPSGIYFARLTAGDFTQTQKLVLLK
ncbi:T9SS type A sorting domain-containing protein [bacterium]|nr:T9SS type A sorting domain-containing protein [bacterium]